MKNLKNTPLNKSEMKKIQGGGGNPIPDYPMCPHCIEETYQDPPYFCYKWNCPILVEPCTEFPCPE